MSNPFEPYAVSLTEARRLLGDMSHSRIYEVIGQGQLEAIKDGQKTLVTMRSIRARQESLPPAKIRAQVR
jgi:IS30 family transposase